MWIEAVGGVNKILDDEHLLRLHLKSREVQTLGVMIDADTNGNGRYESFRNRCKEFFPLLPISLPSSGLILDNEEGKRLGFWMMPENRPLGDFETFLRNLVPPDQQAVWEHAVESFQQAKALGADCKDCHASKAQLYTWLAWQDEPGYSPGAALTRKILNPLSPSAVAFVEWFKELYQLKSRTNSVIDCT